MGKIIIHQVRENKGTQYIFFGMGNGRMHNDKSKKQQLQIAVIRAGTNYMQGL